MARYSRAMEMGLFSAHQVELPGTPLPEKLRPQHIDQLFGQKEATNLWKQIEKTQQVPSLILWGPPGTGKTSFALALIRHLNLRSESVNAIEVGAKSLREIGQQARDYRMQFQQRTVLFIDEIHRLNKSQQDVLLPFVERGEFILIGATTENPSYALNRALMSRCHLVVFNPLGKDSLSSILEMATSKFGTATSQILSNEARESLINLADGDARKLLANIERLHAILLEKGPEIAHALSSEEMIELLGAKSSVGYDRQSDQHYDTISAFIKSIRGSDADAGLYYLARMIKAGEDPVFIARRLVVLASEDIGNADPRAISLAVATTQAVELIGLPEAAINLAQAVSYLACAPKSNRSYKAFRAAQEVVDKTGTKPIPLHLRSSQKDTMRNIGYGVGYKYPHDFAKNYVRQKYLPEGVNGPFYEPSERGFEKQISDYVRWLKSEPQADPTNETPNSEKAT